MPIEIKELVIRAVVLPPAPQDAGRSTADGASDGAGPRARAIVEACVKEVLRILKRAQER